MKLLKKCKIAFIRCAAVRQFASLPVMLFASEVMSPQLFQAF